MSNHREIVVAASALSMVLAAQADAQDKQSRSGVAGYVRGNVQAMRGDGRLARVRVGDAIFRDQRIVTDARSRMQVMLVDKSMVTVGPNADMTIQRYSFDKKKEEGNLVISAAKGLFRFVGGLLSKRNPVRVRTPTATIGIRGAIVFVEGKVEQRTNPDTGQSEDTFVTSVTFFYGDSATVTPDAGPNAGQTLNLNQPGFYFDLDAFGGVQEGRLSADDVAALAGQLEGIGATGSVSDAGSSTEGLAGQPIVLELNDDNTLKNLKEVEDAINNADINFDNIQSVLQDIAATIAASGGGGGGGGGAMAIGAGQP